MRTTTSGQGMCRTSRTSRAVPTRPGEVNETSGEPIVSSAGMTWTTARFGDGGPAGRRRGETQRRGWLRCVTQRSVARARARIHARDAKREGTGVLRSHTGGQLGAADSAQRPERSGGAVVRYRRSGFPNSGPPKATLPTDGMHETRNTVPSRAFSVPQSLMPARPLTRSAALLR
jgi:hypothetical protein